MVTGFFSRFRSTCELWEIKPKEFIESIKNKLKTEAAQQWCALNVIEILTGDFLRQRGII